MTKSRILTLRNWIAWIMLGVLVMCVIVWYSTKAQLRRNRHGHLRFGLVARQE